MLGNLSDSDFDVSELLTVNRNFARQYEERKRREELQILAEKYEGRNMDGGSEIETDSESSGSDEDEGMGVDAVMDARILKTISLIRAGDSSIYDTAAVFFDAEEVQKQHSRGEKRAATLSLKEYHNQRLGKEEFSEDESVPKTYNEEQEQVRNDLLRAVGDGSDEEEEEEEIIRRKESSGVEENDHEYRLILKNALEKEDRTAETMREWLKVLGNEGKAKKKERTRNAVSADVEHGDGSEAFLARYILDKGWISRQKGEIVMHGAGVEDGDEAHLDKAEEFETAFNMRHESVGHSRNLSGVRKVDDSRVQKRKAKEAKKAGTKVRETEELKRLKNLKRAEIQSRLDVISKVGGVDAVKLGKVLEEDYDSDFDKKMAAVYDETYYAQEEEEDDRERIEDVKQSGPSLSNVDEETIRDLEDAYLGLHYEDKIGDTEVRFKYRRVVPSTYGLKMEEILSAEDKRLNRHVSLKKLRPYIDADEEQKFLSEYSHKKAMKRFRYDHSDKK